VCFLFAGGVLLVVGRAADSSASHDPPGRTWHSERMRGYRAVQISHPPPHLHSEVRLRMGDDPAWAYPQYDDSDWEVITRRGLPSRSGIFWVRYRIRADGPLPAGIYNKVGAAYELYWDGRLIGRSGTPGASRAEEEPGKLDSAFSIPPEWIGTGSKAAGGRSGEHKTGKPVRADVAPSRTDHVVAMRLSNYRYYFPGERTDLQVWFIAPEERLATFNRIALEPTLAAGAMFMIAVVSLMMWLIAARRPALLLLVGLCSCAALTQTLMMLRYSTSYSYEWHYAVRLANVWLAGGMGICLVAFVCGHFAIQRSRWLVGAQVLAFGVLLGSRLRLHDQPLSETANMILLAAFLLTLVAAGRAVSRRHRGASWVAIGAIASILAGGNVLEGRFFPTFLPMLLGVLAAVAIRLRDERRSAEEARLSAARLEVELLRKNLQPHFFLNTLTALSEVVERNPRGAVQLIEDMADGFRALARMTGEKQVPLAQELELCRAHLRVMNVRTGVVCRLRTECVDESEPVPPALFLTLIENGFAHQQVRDGEREFVLRTAPLAGAVRYSFFSPGEIKVRPLRTAGGTGLRYVKARLQESFAGRWSLRDGAVAGGWETVIQIQSASGERLVEQPSVDRPHLLTDQAVRP
jgi:hypothetical protein